MKLVSLTITSSTKESIIQDAIRSCALWVDEIVISHIPLGSDSTLDKATGTAYNLGRRCSVFPMRPGMRFFEWRNEAFEHAAKVGADWAIIVDTDERIHLNGLDIRKFLESVPSDVNVINVTATDGTYSKEKIFRIPTSVKYRHDVHEEPHGVTGMLAPQMRFHELPRTPEAAAARVQHILEGLTLQISEEPENARWRYFMGGTLAFEKRYAEALPHFEDAIKLTSDSGLKAWIRYQQALCHLHLEDPATALEAAVSGLLFSPILAELHWVAGQACAELQRPWEAIEWEYQAIHHGMTPDGKRNHMRYSLVEPRALFEGPAQVLAIVYAELGDEKMSRLYTDKLVEWMKLRLDYFEKGVRA